MRMRDGDRDARVAELERRRAGARSTMSSVPKRSLASRAMSASSRSAIDRYAVYSMPVTRAAIVDVAHGADEQQRRTVRRSRDLAR